MITMINNMLYHSLKINIYKGFTPSIRRLLLFFICAVMFCVQPTYAQDTPPTANDATFYVRNVSDSYIYVLLNDEEGDAPIDPSTIEIIEEPEHADELFPLTQGGELIYRLFSEISETTDSFTYRVSDTEGRQSNIATISLNIVEASNFSVFDKTAILDEGITLVTDLSEYVFYPQNGVDMSTLEMLEISDPEGNVSLEDSILTYNHPEPLPGPDELSSQFEDYFELFLRYTVQSVDSTYSRPIEHFITFTEFINDTVSVAEGRNLNFNAFENYEEFNIAVGADFPIDSTTVEILQGPSHGTINLDPDNPKIVSYTADPGTSGMTDEIIISGASDPNDPEPFTIFSVFIEITDAPEGAPTANDASFKVRDVGDSYIYVLLNDEEGDDPIDPSTIEIIDGPEHADSLFAPTDGGELIYRFDSQTSETTDSFSYMVSDTEGRESNVATVNLEIINSTDFTTFFGSMLNGEGTILVIDLAEYVFHQADIDVTTIEILEISDPDGVEELENGILTYNHPDPLGTEVFELTYNYTVQSTDGLYSPPVSHHILYTDSINSMFEVTAGIETELNVFKEYDDELLATDFPIVEETIIILTQPEHGTAELDPDNKKTVRYRADSGFEGSDQFEMKGFHETTQLPATIFRVILDVTIDPKPVFTSTFDETTIFEGQLFEFQFEAEDPNDEPITFSLTEGDDVENASITDDGLFSFEPETGQAGSHNFTVRANNNEHFSEHSFIIHVEENLPPVADDFTITIDQDTSVLIDVLAHASDPDGDELTIENFTQPENGTTALEEDKIRYTPDDGFIGTDSFEYTVSDGRGGTDSGTVTIEVEEVIPPVANDVNVEMNADDGSVFIDVLANDEAPESELDPSTLTVVTPPENGTAEVEIDDDITGIRYTPDEGFDGTDTITYTVANTERVISNEATVTVNVEPGNRPPEFTKVLEDSTITGGEILEFQFEAEDPDGDPLTFSLSEGNDVENASITEDGLFTFAPEIEQTGSFEFTVRVSDGELFDEHDFEIHVEAPNQPPMFTTMIDEETIAEGDEFEFQFEAEDPDGDELTFSLVQGENIENASMSDDGLFTFSPDFGQAGSYNFTAQVSDGELTDEHDFVIHVEETNRPPEFTTVIDEETIAEGDEFEFQFEAEDPDGDELTFSLIHGENIENVSMSGDGLFTFSPDFGQAGSYDFTAQVSDGELTDEHEFVIHVEETNRPPEASDITASTRMNLPLELNLLNFVTDPDGDPVEITNVTSPMNGEVVLDEGVVTYTPDLNFTGSDQFSYTASDDKGESDTGTVTVEVLGLAFKVIDLNTPEGSSSRAFDISDTGYITGIVSDGSGSTSGFIWSDGQFKQISQLVQAYGVNNNGVVSGITELFDTALPGLYVDGSVFTGETLGGNFGALFDVNIGNLAVGTSEETDGTVSGFTWSGEDLIPKSLDGADLQLYAVNDADVLAGFAQFNTGDEQAVMFRPDGSHQLLDHGAESGSRAFGVGNNNRITGVVYSGQNVQAASWNDNGELSVKSGLGGSISVAYDINNSGVLAGTSTSGASKHKFSKQILETITGLFNLGDKGSLTNLTSKSKSQKSTIQNDQRAVIWIGDELYDLNELIPTDSGWELIEARAVNNHMEIVGYGMFNGVKKAFLLLPDEVEEPIANTVFEHINVNSEVNLDLSNHIFGAYGQISITDVWGASFGTADLANNRYLSYKSYSEAGSDTLYYRARDTRGAIADGKVIISISELPQSVELFQNYPNPFNPATIISFQLPEAEDVKLEIFDVTGRRVAVLVNKRAEAGRHNITFDASSLSSGVYFYRLTAGQTILMKKLTLIK